MAQSYRSRYLAVHRSNEQAMKSLYSALARDIAAEVTKRADRDGNVPRSAAFELQRAIADHVQSMFLGRDRDGKLAPFTLFPGGVVVPLSPYMRQLWEAIKAAIRIPVEQNAVILANKLPADVLYVMARATRNPFVAAGRVAELFRPDPFAVYAAPHEWVDPNGYRLSDRVWNVAAETRRQIDAYVEDSLRRGIGALEMSRGLQQFLTPGEQLRTTTKPYGRTASYSGMRLARTEITRAHNQAHRLAASMNPFVNGLKWNLSARHPRYDICDEYARGGPGGDGVYEVEAYPSLPHPHCLCYPSNVMISSEESANIIDQLRADIQATRAEFVDLVGPLRVEAFERLLLGEGLTVERLPGQVTRLITPTVTVTPPVVVVRPEQFALASPLGNAAPAAAGRITPVTVTPVGEPVAAHLRLAINDAGARASFEETVRAIGAVHGDGELGDIAVETIVGKNSEGSYRPRLDDRPGRIAMRQTFGAAPVADTTLIHEIGHYIDDYMDLWDEGALRGWSSAVGKTNTYKTLKHLQARDESDYLNYLADRSELFARSYEQWIATRSGNGKLVEILERRQSGLRYPEYWPHDDFLPVAEALDSLFKKLGWLR